MNKEIQAKIYAYLICIKQHSYEDLNSFSQNRTGDIINLNSID